MRDVTHTEPSHFAKGDEVRQLSTGRRGTVRVTRRGRSESRRPAAGLVFVVDSCGTGGWYAETEWELLTGED